MCMCECNLIGGENNQLVHNTLSHNYFYICLFSSHHGSPLLIYLCGQYRPWLSLYYPSMLPVLVFWQLVIPWELCKPGFFLFTLKWLTPSNNPFHRQYRVMLLGCVDRRQYTLPVKTRQVFPLCLVHLGGLKNPPHRPPWWEGRQDDCSSLHFSSEDLCVCFTHSPFWVKCYYTFENHWVKTPRRVHSSGSYYSFKNINIAIQIT